MSTTIRVQKETMNVIKNLRNQLIYKGTEIANKKICRALRMLGKPESGLVYPDAPLDTDQIIWAAVNLLFSALDTEED
jgi:hypothetical protein